MTRFIDGSDIGVTIESLRQIFERNPDPHTEAVMQAIAHVIEDTNVVDDSHPEGSPWRNRPLHLVLAENTEHAPTPREIERQEHFKTLRENYKQQAKGDGEPAKKTWGVSSPTPLATGKTWSV